MRRIRSTNSRPEMQVRKLLHGMGYRYRLHAADLPGKPDLVFSSRRKIVLVHGCFWHLHKGCKEAHIPASRTEYWRPKLGRNRRRDAKVRRELERMGWKVAVVWECETVRFGSLKRRLKAFLL